MNTLTLTAAQPVHVAVNPHAVLRSAYLLAGAALAVYLLVLWVKARLLRGRLTRSLTRSASLGGPRRRSRSLGSPRMVARAGRSRRASRRLRKALFISALLIAVRFWIELHTHTH